MLVETPMCPQCGEPARAVVGLFEVRVGVSLDRDSLQLARTGQIRIGKPVMRTPLKLVCGGSHQWTTRERDDDGEYDE